MRPPADAQPTTAPPPSHLVLVGASGATTPLDLLEQLAVAAQDLPAALAALHAQPAVHEVMVVSTCNRVELYAVVCSVTTGQAALQTFLRDHSGYDDERLCGVLHHAAGQDAVRHLFAVATGLRSLVVGERQITGQLRAAVAASAAAGSCGPQLHALFRAALTVSRQVRRRTGISDAAGSMVDAGLTVVTDTIGDLAGRSVLLIGAGKMGRLVARRLDGQVGRLAVANRTPQSALRLAERTGATMVPWDARGSAVADADLVVCSTGAPTPVLERCQIADAMRERPRRPLVLLDLAVPRDVAAGSGDIGAVTYLDVDTVRAAIVGSGGDDGVRAAEAMVHHEATRFVEHAPTAEVTTTITALRGKGERIRSEELVRAQHQLASFDPAQRQLVEQLTRRIVQRLLHDPSVHLGRPTSCTHRPLDHAQIVAELFEL